MEEREKSPQTVHSTPQEQTSRRDQQTPPSLCMQRKRNASRHSPTRRRTSSYTRTHVHPRRREVQEDGCTEQHKTDLAGSIYLSIYLGRSIYLHICLSRCGSQYHAVAVDRKRERYGHMLGQDCNRFSWGFKDTSRVPTERNISRYPSRDIRVYLQGGAGCVNVLRVEEANWRRDMARAWCTRCVFRGVRTDTSSPRSLRPSSESRHACLPDDE